MKRVFLAINIPINKEFEAYYKSLQRALTMDSMNWVEPKYLHLTIQFFGKTYPNKLERYDKVCQDIIPKHIRFTNDFTELGVFGSRYAPRVLWMGMSADEAFKALKIELLNGFESVGYKPDRQNYVPHLTLARIKEIKSKPYFQKVIDKHRKSPSIQFEVKDVYLYESILHKEGPEYKVIEKYELGCY